MTFDAQLNGHHFLIDADRKVGGRNNGPQPKGLLLTGLGGCIGMDVVSILEKMKVHDFELEIYVEGELTDVYPKYYHTINVKYLFKGKNLPIAKLQKAVDLSENRYCGVYEMLSKSAKINSYIIVNGENI